VTLESQLAEAKAKVDLARSRSNVQPNCRPKCRLATRIRYRRKTSLETSQADLTLSRPALMMRRSSLPYARVLYRLAKSAKSFLRWKSSDAGEPGRYLYGNFLPSEQASKLKMGAEARITLDHAPDTRLQEPSVLYLLKHSLLPSRSRQRVSVNKTDVPRQNNRFLKSLSAHYIERIKTGVRGVGYVKLTESAVWPAKLQNLIKPGMTRKIQPVTCRFQNRNRNQMRTIIKSRARSRSLKQVNYITLEI